MVLFLNSDPNVRDINDIMIIVPNVVQVSNEPKNSSNELPLIETAPDIMVVRDISKKNSQCFDISFCIFYFQK